MPAQVTFTHPLDADELFPTLWPKLNADLEAIASWFWSTDGSAPATTLPNMVWVDESGGYVKQRNTDDDGWTVIGRATPDGQEPHHLGVLGCYVTAGAENSPSADDIVATVQVTDARASAAARNVTGKRFALVVVAATSGGAPGGTQTLTVTTGTLVASLDSNKVLLVESDSSGTIAVKVNASGATARYLRAAVGDGVPSEVTLTWTA